jgi:lipoate-protein ligase A
VAERRAGGRGATVAAVRLVRQAFPDRPAFDMAVTHALLRRVAAGALPPLVRVFRPGPTVAFGRLDALAPGYAAAVAAGRRHGAEPVLRLGGGHAAAYGPGAVLVEAVTPQQAIAEGLQERFREGVRWITGALAAVGVDGEVGELPGEYCAGAWSVHVQEVKVAGLAQRAIRGAALLTGFVLVEGGADLRALLTDVYAALGLEWNPLTAGAVDTAAPGPGVSDVESALVHATAAGPANEPLVLDDETLALARRLEPGHRARAGG